MQNTVLVIVKTARHRYAVRRDEVIDIKIVQPGQAIQFDSSSGHECIGVELGPLLDPADRSVVKRQRALVVQLRRRPIALLVDEVETFLEHTDSLPLPGLLRDRLGAPWAVGALLLGGELIVQLDLRAVARSALRMSADQDNFVDLDLTGTYRER